MYPFSTRLRWVVAGRYAHILAAAARNPVTDSLVMERLASMRRWNQVHLVVGSLLLVGLVGAAATAAADAARQGARFKIAPKRRGYESLAGAGEALAGALATAPSPGCLPLRTSPSTGC